MFKKLKETYFLIQILHKLLQRVKEIIFPKF